MAEENLCTIFSFNKAHFGMSQGNLLTAFPNRQNLCFDGTSPNDCTVFSRKNKRKTCTLYITMSGVKYGICEQEVNKTITLKEVDSASVFSIKAVPGLSGSLYMFIKSKKSGLYLTCDINGKPIMRPSDEVKQGRTGWFILQEHYTTHVDGMDSLYSKLVLEDGNDDNNNTEPNVKPRSITFCEVKEASPPEYTRSRSVQ